MPLDFHYFIAGSIVSKCAVYDGLVGESEEMAIANTTEKKREVSVQ
jgi:hypothetical protein